MKYQSSESAQLIYIGGLSTKEVIGVGPLFISEGCPRFKTNTFVWKWFSHTWKIASMRESVRIGYDINIHIERCIFYMNVCE